jgi:hypothetical protein
MANDTVIEIWELHPLEMELLRSIRHRWRFGDMTITCKDGLPFRIKRVEEFIDLARKH